MKRIIIASVFSLLFFAGCKPDTVPTDELSIILRNNSQKRLFVQYYIAPEKYSVFSDSAINKDGAEKNIVCMVIEPGESFTDYAFDNLDPCAYLEKIVIIDAVSRVLVRQIDEIKPDMFTYEEGVTYIDGDPHKHYKRCTFNLLPAE
jgi:hypothetical protein